ncbi:histidine kinase [Mucilaginibacter sp.]|uniref:sensor histidine kinase n=1 Tax=Mucilaginibacter sp. TaxID=1882438 RepID=UPI0025D7FAA6|nr:histidine kinase [Mucilaginibacter sp.]
MIFKRIKPAVIIEVLLHLLFWAFITFIPVLSRPSDGNFRGLFSPWHLVLINFLLAVQFYLNAFYLIPVILNNKKKVWLYFSLLLLSFVTLDFIMVHSRPAFIFPGGRMPFGPLHKPPFFVNFNLLPLAAITAAGFAYRYLADQFAAISNKRDITNASLVSELAFLRSQISPHFIFNVINSTVALSRLNPTAVEPTLIQLSKLLRYMLYISDEQRVTMAQKVDYLRSYIELQMLRFGSAVKVDFKFDVTEPERAIEPMLLIPFVENAFKYGTGNVAEPAVNVYLKTTGGLLDFSVTNTYDPGQLYKDEDHGIGLNNVKRRLELLYPGKHCLIISQPGNVYTVNLQIQLK